MSTHFINVHTFDGKLEKYYNSKNKFSTEEKIKLFSEFRNSLKHPIAVNMINVIIEDLNNNKNIDKSNNIDSSDILSQICLKIAEKNEIDLSFIEEQLVDIFMLGSCPEGRTTRFLQIWLAIKDC